MRTPLLRYLGATFAAALLASACGSDDVEAVPFGEEGSSGSSGSSGTSSGTFGDGDGGAGTSSGARGDGGNCFAPVDMYIMLDRSNSMRPDCNIGDAVGSKWCRAITALSGYLKSPAAKDQGAAIQFFPLPNQTNTSCTTGDVFSRAAAPATEYTTLPSNSFDALLDTTNLQNSTPTEGAIRGITSFTAANRRPGRVTIGILITDGDPSGCDENLDNLAALLRAHNQATMIRTYVIGMTGATFANLEKMAVGGGAPQHPATVGALTNACGSLPGPCTFWNVGDGEPQAFIAALEAIQKSADGCNPDGGGAVNPPR